MADPVTAGLFLGKAATVFAHSGVATAATTGLFGAGGAFALAPTLLTLGVGAAAVGTLESSKAQQAQLASQAAIEEANAELEESKAREAQRAAIEEARLYGEEGERLLSTQQARLAASGIDPSRGSALTVLQEQAKRLTLDRLTILREGGISGDIGRSRADVDRMAAKSLKKRRRAVSRAGALSAGGTILSGLGDVL